MPCCLILAIALLGPRIVIAFLALFNDYFERPFDGLVLPLLGFLFLPFTTLAYAWAINFRGEVAGVGLAVVVLALLLDLGVVGGGAARQRRQMP